MPKYKKTRKQKILADHRREVSNAPTYSLPTPSSEKIMQESVVPIKQASISTKSYTYLARDLRKTIIFTGGIILIELLLRTFIK